MALEDTILHLDKWVIGKYIKSFSYAYPSKLLMHTRDNILLKTSGAMGKLSQ